MTTAGSTISLNADTIYAFLSVTSFFILTPASIDPITIMDIGTVMSPMSLKVSLKNEGILHGITKRTMARIDATDTGFLKISRSLNFGFLEKR